MFGGLNLNEPYFFFILKSVLDSNSFGKVFKSRDTDFGVGVKKVRKSKSEMDWNSFGICCQNREAELKGSKVD